ncbi:Late embryogenesis abundant protein 2 [Burkholderia multivorans]
MLRSAFRLGWLRAALSLCILAIALGGCASLSSEPVRVTVVGLEPLAGQGLEMRFNLKLRVQNPRDAAIEYEGIALDLELNGSPFASGVSNRAGVVPRFGEAVLEVPVTVSAFAAARQAGLFADAASAGELPYALHGRLAGGMLGTMRFSDAGVLRLPAMPGWGG